MHESETENKPFVLIARIHVKPGNVDQYLEIAAKVDSEVENSESAYRGGSVIGC